MFPSVSSQDIQLMSNIVLAVFTVVLALVTYLYYRQTKAQTEEMKKSRKETSKQVEEMEKSRKVTAEQTEQMKKSREAQFEPIIIPYAAHNVVGTSFFIALENIGEGIAKDLKVEWYIEGIENSERVYYKPVFQPSERRIFDLPLDGGSDKSLDGVKAALEGASGKLVASVDYKDVLGNSHEHDFEIDIVQQLEGRFEAGEMYVGDMEYSNLGRYESPPSGSGHDL